MAAGKRRGRHGRGGKARLECAGGRRSRGLGSVLRDAREDERRDKEATCAFVSPMGRPGRRRRSRALGADLKKGRAREPQTSHGERRPGLAAGRTARAHGQNADDGRERWDGRGRDAEGDRPQTGS